MKSLLLFTIVLTSFQITSYGQKVAVYDLMNGKTHSWPHDLVGLNNEIWLYAEDNTQKYKLTSIDIGTGAKTVHPWAVTPDGDRSILAVGNDLYFAGTPSSMLPNIRLELRKMDANKNVKQCTKLSSPTGSVPIFFLTELNGKIYFSTSTNTSAGMVPGTIFEYDPVRDTTIDCLAPSGRSLRGIRELIAYKNKIYFTGRETATGTEIYCYNPANRTTTLLKDIHKGNKNSWPSLYKVINGKLYFVASTTGVSTDTTVFGKEIYVYDGTNPVRRVTDLNPGVYNSIHGAIIEYDNHVYFGGTDGTNEGIYKLNTSTDQVQPVYIFPNGNVSLAMMNVHNKILYFAGSTSAFGYELWKYDGVNKPAMVVDLMPGVDWGLVPSNMRFSLVYNNKFFFCARDTAHGNEVFHFEDVETSVANAYSKNEAVKVYPNPASDMLQIVLPSAEGCEISITDISGKVVEQQKLQENSTKHVIDISGLGSGIYFLRVTSDNIMDVKKIVIE